MAHLHDCSAGQAEAPQPRHGSRHARPHRHAASFGMTPGDKPFASFPASPDASANGMHPGSAAEAGNAASAERAPMDGAFSAFLRSPGPATNGIHAGVGAKPGNAGKAASADAAAQLPPRFASAVNISEGDPLP